MVRCLVIILALVVGDVGRMVCYGLGLEQAAGARTAPAEEGCRGGCGEGAPKPCESRPAWPRPVPRDCCGCCPLDQGVVIPQRKQVGEQAAAAPEVLAPAWKRARVVGGAVRVRRGLPGIDSRMRRAVLCIRTI